ncbi:MAG: HAD family hydrolase [Epsilonproteobacteria bacterium]|nr:MAG: HAD family hydrolase [Campylobacterota bacterium]
MIKNIIFDFDGVILDSIPVKAEAFRRLFQSYDQDIVNKFIDFHLVNGGMSRYLKIRYFFEQLLSQDISEQKITQLAEKYSELTKKELAQQQYLIQDTLTFIKENHQKYNMHIASGAAENDLRFICDRLNLSQYFLSVMGSPQHKNDLVKSIVDNYQYKKDETILIGDSVNDLEAAVANEIAFYGYNNPTLNTQKYIQTFTDCNL